LAQFESRPWRLLFSVRETSQVALQRFCDTLQLTADTIIQPKRHKQTFKNVPVRLRCVLPKKVLSSIFSPGKSCVPFLLFVRETMMTNIMSCGPFIFLCCVLLFLLPWTTTARRIPPGSHSSNNATTTSIPRRYLAGKNVDVSKANAPEDHLVTDLPLLDKTKFPTDHWAGLLPASSKGDKYLFYWLFAPSETESKADAIDFLVERRTGV
jgi:hypothetical protein